MLTNLNRNIRVLLILGFQSICLLEAKFTPQESSTSTELLTNNNLLNIYTTTINGNNNSDDNCISCYYNNYSIDANNNNINDYSNININNNNNENLANQFHNQNFLTSRQGVENDDKNLNNDEIIENLFSNNNNEYANNDNYNNANNNNNVENNQFINNKNDNHNNRNNDNNFVVDSAVVNSMDFKVNNLQNFEMNEMGEKQNDTKMIVQQQTQIDQQQPQTGQQQQQKEDNNQPMIKMANHMEMNLTPKPTPVVKQTNTKVATKSNQKFTETTKGAIIKSNVGSSSKPTTSTTTTSTGSSYGSGTAYGYGISNAQSQGSPPNGGGGDVGSVGSVGSVTGNGGNSGQSFQPNTKFYRPNGFPNPIGQLVAFLGADQLNLQDYNFLFNAERHTIFQLHTMTVPTTMTRLKPKTTTTTSMRRPRTATTRATNKPTTTTTQTKTTTISKSKSKSNGGRVLHHVVTNSIGVAFGVNMAGGGSGGTSNVSYSNVEANEATNPLQPVIKVEEVQLYNADSLRQSRFNPFNPTRILIHGWMGGSRAAIYTTLVAAYLSRGTGNYNVFTVDWGRGAVADYITASYRVKPVGKVVAMFIDFLQREAGIRFEDLHVVGFSMGAHVAGIAGKYVQTGRLPVIYALDPALPFFRYENIDERVAITDADYVEVLHTSVSTYGYDRPLGHTDFYANFGSAQPGCFFNECSHTRAFQIFAESVLYDDAFVAQGCDWKLWQDLIKNRRCQMGTGRNLTVGGDPQNVEALKRRGGVYYFATNAESPFAVKVFKTNRNNNGEDLNRRRRQNYSKKFVVGKTKTKSKSK